MIIFKHPKVVYSETIHLAAIIRRDPVEKTMDLASTCTYIEERCASDRPLLIYVAIGCSLELYPAGDHPAQQYPPYLRTFDCPQICVLIDPRLEMPARVLTDIAGETADITILPVLQYYHHTSNYGESTSWFLERLATACLLKQAQLIVQDYTGENIHPYYPIHLDRGVLKKVLYDPTYRDGGCFVDMSAIQIYRDAEGGFIQPMYTPLSVLRGLVPHDVFMEQLRAHKYPTLSMLLRLYKILRGLAEPRDWCTVERMGGVIRYYSFIYGVSATSVLETLRNILMASVKDMYALAQRGILTEAALTSIVDSPGDEMGWLWNDMSV